MGQSAGLGPPVHLPRLAIFEVTGYAAASVYQISLVQAEKVYRLKISVCARLFTKHLPLMRLASAAAEKAHFTIELTSWQVTLRTSVDGSQAPLDEEPPFAVVLDGIGRKDREGSALQSAIHYFDPSRFQLPIHLYLRAGPTQFVGKITIRPPVFERLESMVELELNASWHDIRDVLGYLSRPHRTAAGEYAWPCPRFERVVMSSVEGGDWPIGDWFLRRTLQG